MKKKVLVGAVQKGSENTTTYFYLGAADLQIQCFTDKLKELKEEVISDKILCIAVEKTGEPDTDGKLVGFAYLRENGKILIISADKFREEYLNLYAREAIIYYDKG